MLKKFDGGRYGSIWDIVTRNEMYTFQYDPETKQQSTMWPTCEIQVIEEYWRTNGAVLLV